MYSHQCSVVCAKTSYTDAKTACIHTHTHTHTQSYNLSVHVNVTSDAYFGENSALEQRLANFHGDVVQFSSSFSFGLPHSQDQLTTYLGER